MEREIVDYKTLSFSSQSGLDGHVKDCLKEGWAPFGPAQPFAFGSSFALLQTMVKYKESHKKKFVVAKIINGKQHFLMDSISEPYFTQIFKDAFIFESFERARFYTKGHGEVSIEEAKP